MIPWIDPELNVERLQNGEKTVVIQDSGKPLAVLVPYEIFMEIQAALNQKPIDRAPKQA